MQLLYFNFHKGFTRLCPGGESTTLIHDISKSYTQQYVITLEGEGLVSGTYEVTRGLFGGTSETMPLAPEILIERGWMDRIFKVEIHPEQTITLCVAERGGTARMMTYLVNFWLWVVVLGAIVLLGGYVGGLMS